jgi:hypothetical protein
LNKIFWGGSEDIRKTTWISWDRERVFASGGRGGGMCLHGGGRL